MIQVLTVVQNDELYDLNFTVQDNDNVVVDLTGSTIKLKVAGIGATTLELDGDCDLVVAANGTCKYTVQNGELATIGIFHAELQITYTSSGKIITTKGFDVNVVNDLPL